MILYKLQLLQSLNDQEKTTCDFCPEILTHFEDEGLWSIIKAFIST